MGYYRRLPPVVRQHRAWSCWAAALDSWTSVTRGRTRQNQDDLISAYATGDDGSLDPTTGFPPIASDLGLDYRVVRGSSLTSSYVEEHLRNYGHLVIAYNRPDGSSHAVVIYGVGRPTGQDLMISMMDPNGGHYRNRTVAWFNAIDFILVAWPSW